MNKAWRLAAHVAGCLSLAGAGCGEDPPTSDRAAPASVTALLSGANADPGFARAERVRRFAFPRDHGAHPAFRSEWWYLTGNLESADRRRFGYQVTLFRNALAPGPPGNPSAWATHQVYLAHAAITDVSRGRFVSRERLARGALGLAGAHGEPLRVWLENWSLAAHGAPSPDCTDCLHAVLSVVDRAFTLALELRAAKPPALHGDRGLSFKGPTPGNASYYYSYTRLETRGTISIDAGDPVPVDGLSWFDHEWSTSALSPDQTGWDWFSLQLSDATEVMVFRLRSRTTRQRDFISGSLVAPDGHTTPLARAAIESVSHWRSPVTGVTYPSGWRISLPEQALEFELEPLLDDQEMNHMFRYWEGAVRVTGRAAGRPVEGYGYGELTGYD